MKDLLNYYYFLLPNKIYMINNNYFFSYNNYFFGLYLYKNNIDDINNIFNLNNYMLLNNFKINKIILNKDSKILTIRNNKYYCLVQLFFNNKNIINLKNIIEFNKQRLYINILNRSNWYYLWINKIDNIEYILNHLKNKYKILYNSSFYYIGLTENAISYLNYYKDQNNNLGICHKRINSNLENDFYNPLNLIIDYKVRDIAEYYKYMFFYKKVGVNDILLSLKKIKMSGIDYIYFYIRMLYPSYFFDILDNILNEKVNENDIFKITNMQDDYEYLLYLIYNYLKNKINLLEIKWLNNKN